MKLLYPGVCFCRCVSGVWCALATRMLGYSLCQPPWQGLQVAASQTRARHVRNTACSGCVALCICRILRTLTPLSLRLYPQLSILRPPEAP